MEFVIRQQEGFAEGMVQLESHTKGEARLSRIEAVFVDLYNTVTEIGEAQKNLTERMTALTESRTHTDQRINVLIDILQEGRNGKSQS
ncbi:MAG TPA: hypothetical protein VM866_12480 [Pyrinomonadaceae bacterium]|jgi:hypothetical protein|nr:hypothetical protein [Pyrinomonadaceae bacterium]